MFKKISFYGYVTDINTGKPMEDVIIKIEACAGTPKDKYCDKTSIANAKTNADGFYEVKARAAKSTSYFFSVEGGVVFERNYSEGEAFKNDFALGRAKYWNTVHIKNTNPFNNEDRLAIGLPAKIPYGLVTDSIILKGQMVDTTLTIECQLNECCVETSQYPVSGVGYTIIKNNMRNDKYYSFPVKLRDTSFSEVQY